MAETIDDLTMDFFEGEGADKIQKVKQLDKNVLTKGAWTTIIFKYQDLDPKTGEFSEPKYSIRRFQKSAGEYKYRSKFNISGDKQALQIAEVLTAWATNTEKKEK